MAVRLAGRPSFSEDCRRELAFKYPKDRCCVDAEILAFLRTAGSLHIGPGSVILEVQLGHAFLVRRLFKLLKEGLDLSPHVVLRRGQAGHAAYLVRAALAEGTPLRQLLDSLGLGSPGEPQSHALGRRCCRRSYLKAAFLATGSISDPSTGTHHLEIRCRTEEATRVLLKFLGREGICGRSTRRRSDWLVYLKEADEISKFLCVVGAHGALLRYEESRVICQLRGEVNRVVNCETANLSRTVEAALRQIADIGVVDEAVGLEHIPEGLREVAELRLRYPHLNFREIGEMLDPKISKSGVSHRFRQIAEIAGRLRGLNGSP